MTQKDIESERWYACRIFHNKIEYIKQRLTKDGIRYFIPVRLEQKEQEENFVYIEEPILVKGNCVRIIGGLFKGAEVCITRIHGTKRFAVIVKGVAAVATTFIPRCF